MNVLNDVHCSWNILNTLEPPLSGRAATWCSETLVDVSQWQITLPFDMGCRAALATSSPLALQLFSMKLQNLTVYDYASTRVPTDIPSPRTWSQLYMAIDILTGNGIKYKRWAWIIIRRIWNSPFKIRSSSAEE